MSNQSTEPSAQSAVLKFIVVVIIGLALVGLLGIGVYYLRFIDPGGSLAAATPQGPGSRLVLPLANYSFVPNDITIPVGTIILFQNVDDDSHTVTFDDNQYPALGLEEGDGQEILFDQVGVYQVYCEIHGSPGLRGMSAIIRVVPSSASVGVPTAASIPTPTPRPTIVPLSASALSNGFGLFLDTLGRSDSFNLTVSHLPAAVPGSYRAWLTGQGAMLDLGPLVPDPSGAANLLYFTSSDDNLLARYNGFLITLEVPGTTPSQPSSTVVFGGVIAPGVLGPARQLLVAGDRAPHQTGYAIGLVEQTEELILHARELDNAAQAGDLASMNRHIEHLSALVAGKGSPAYQDFEGNGFVSDPGDGFGILNYADAIIRQAQAAASAPDANVDQKRRAADLEIVANSIRELSNQLIVLRSAAYEAQAASERTVFTGKIFELSTHLLNGVDANGNGVIEPIPGEGGAYTAYFQSQYLAAMGAQAGEPPGAAPGTAEPTFTAELTPTEGVLPPPDTPAPAAPGPSATPGPALVVTHNFAFAPDVLTVKAGTTVVFIIEGSRHQVFQSFPDSEETSGFDSGPLPAGEQFAFTFNDPGTYTIRCRRHLQSMVMTLVVEP